MDKETEKEFAKVRTEFSDYYKKFDDKLDELFLEIRKPLFTYPQVIGGVVAMLIYTFYITRDFSGIKSMAETTKENVEKQNVQIKEDRKANAEKLDKIYEVVIQTNIDVAVLKEKKTEYNSRKATIENNKDIIRNWANGNQTK